MRCATLVALVGTVAKGMQMTALKPGTREVLEIEKNEKKHTRHDSDTDTKKFTWDVNRFPLEHASTSLPPVMMFAHGCSMTTAGIYLLRMMLTAHGVWPAETGNGELMKSLEADRTKEDFQRDMGNFGQEFKYVEEVEDTGELHTKFEVVNQWAKTMNMTLVFKNEYRMTYDEDPKDDDHIKLMLYLQSVGTKAFFYKRWNYLDVFHCMVEDFCDTAEFDDTYGGLVDEDGKDVKCKGFRGRGTEQTPSKAEEKEKMHIKVKLNVDNLLTHLDYQDERDKDHQQYLKDHGFDVMRHTVSAEHLLAFESSEDDIEYSARAWSRVLGHIGVEPSDHIIKKTMKKWGTFDPPKKHSESFHNVDEIKAALKGTKYEEMLRS